MDQNFGESTLPQITSMKLTRISTLFRLQKGKFKMIIIYLLFKLNVINHVIFIVMSVLSQTNFVLFKPN